METNNVVRLVAPFVLKTYQIVDDPSTDSFNAWGKANNSFVVINPINFSRKILPVYFKHDNFSSFVRQLNTYRFRKVDPDRWEFANESFLRGEKQLLKNIIRRKSNRSSSYTAQIKQEDGMLEEEEKEGKAIMLELSRLKQEQKALEDELQGMNERLQITERRPKQMMTFLFEVMEDPDLIPGVMLGDKKRRLMIESSSTMTTTTTMSSAAEEEEVSLPEMGFGVESFSGSPPSNMSPWLTRRITRVGPETSQFLPSPSEPLATVAHPIPANLVTFFQELGGGVGLSGDGMEVNDTHTPPYPFCLLGGGGSGF
ncbi:heat stress transcription factor C-1-like [Macadamia integrifolia]|uniref:heat stress transcription factor C-1-like n=1 Tax=Macadamia integrifolia TaxID=60698 RepID=UPI001C4FC5C0|nr:heat stress transcription factor C-1-like [Macadamia integrifolia]